jgi:hypothetical protein
MGRGGHGRRIGPPPRVLRLLERWPTQASMKGTSRRRVVVGYRKPDGHADDADGLHDGWRKQDDFDEHLIE